MAVIVVEAVILLTAEQATLLMLLSTSMAGHKRPHIKQNN